jgi:hypothetical protein
MTVGYCTQQSHVRTHLSGEYSRISGAACSQTARFCYESCFIANQAKSARHHWQVISSIFVTPRTYTHTCKVAPITSAASGSYLAIPRCVWQRRPSLEQVLIRRRRRDLETLHYTLDALRSMHKPAHVSRCSSSAGTS